MAIHRPLLAWGRQHWPVGWRVLDGRQGARLALGAALASMLALRCLPGAYLQSTDQMLGRAGDSTLLLAALALLGIWCCLPARSDAGQRKVPQGAPLAAAQGLLSTHLQLDKEIDNKLQEVVLDTESSALAIIAEVRKLYDSANTLEVYLDNSSLQSNHLGKDIVASVSYLVDIGDFIAQLPEKMTRDLHSVQSVVKELNELSMLVGSVHAISMQSHLLALNAAIESSHAGPAGAAFRVVADEMRLLAQNSSGVASKINEGLVRARLVVEDGMTLRIAESSKALGEVSQAVAYIHKLKENFQDMSQYFKTRFAVITQHNQNLTRDIAEVLGHIQYQDVVSQCVGRLRLSIGRRNGFFEQALANMQQGDIPAAALQPLLAQILTDFLEEEQRHKHSARHDEQVDGELKFELF